MAAADVGDCLMSQLFQLSCINYLPSHAHFDCSLKDSSLEDIEAGVVGTYLVLICLTLNSKIKIKFFFLLSYTFQHLTIY